MAQKNIPSVSPEFVQSRPLFDLHCCESGKFHADCLNEHRRLRESWFVTEPDSCATFERFLGGFCVKMKSELAKRRFLLDKTEGSKRGGKTSFGISYFFPSEHPITDLILMIPDKQRNRGAIPNQFHSGRDPKNLALMVPQESRSTFLPHVRRSTAPQRG